MTPSEIIEEARTCLHGTDHTWPVNEAFLHMRINARQRQLFTLPVLWKNLEYFGKQVTAPLVDGCVDLMDLEGTELWPIESIDRIEVASPGTSRYKHDRKVTIVKASERFDHHAPRVTIRSHFIEEVQTTVREEDGSTMTVGDLEGVDEIRIWYSRRPKTINGLGKVRLLVEDESGVETVEQRVQDVEIGDPWDWLLVHDLVKSIIKRTAQDDAEEDDPSWQLADEAEKELLALFQAHVKGFTHGMEMNTE